MNTSARWSVLAAVTLVGAALFVWQMLPPKGAPAAPAATLSFVIDEGSTQRPTGPLRPPREAPSGMREYRNEKYRFALFYPADFAVKEFDEGGGAATITFERSADARGFQIFVVPYGAPQITPERFAMDAPSGVFVEPQTISIDGALATIFYGAHPAIGETREVWFIRGGHLFEVSAPRPLDAWLGEIMLTWQFI